MRDVLVQGKTNLTIRINVLTRCLFHISDPRTNISVNSTSHLWIVIDFNRQELITTCKTLSLFNFTDVPIISKKSHQLSDNYVPTSSISIESRTEQFLKFKCSLNETESKWFAFAIVKINHKGEVLTFILNIHATPKTINLFLNH